MPIYTITTTNRYQVETDTAENALKLFRISFDGIEPSFFDLPNSVLENLPEFEPLDGIAEVSEEE